MPLAAFGERFAAVFFSLDLSHLPQMKGCSVSFKDDDIEAGLESSSLNQALILPAHVDIPAPVQGPKDG